MQKESYYSLICECISRELILDDVGTDLDFIKGKTFAIVELLNTILYLNLSTDIMSEKFEDTDFVNLLKNQSQRIVLDAKSEDYSLEYKNGILWGLGEVLLNVVNHYKPYEFQITGKKINISMLEKLAYGYMGNS